MINLRILGRNIASNVTGFAVQVAVAFLLTPFILHTLGDARYGVWVLVMGLTGYYGLLDVGFRSGLTQYLARYLATGDFDKLNRTVSTGFVALVGCGAIISIASVLLGHFAHAIFNLPTEVEREVVWCIWIVGGSVAIQFAFFPFSAVFTATQRFDIANIIGVLTRLAGAAATYICLKAGYGLVGLSLVTAGSNLVDYGLRWRIAYRILPQLRVSPRLTNWSSCWELASFGLWNFAIAGGSRLISYTHSIIIGIFMPVAAIASYALASSLRNYFEQVFIPIGHVFFPAATQLDAAGNVAGLRRMYMGGSRFLYTLAIVLGVIAIFLADDFFRLWVGARYVETGGFGSVSLLFCLLLVGTVCAAGQRIGYQVLMGIRQLKTLSLLFATEGACNLLLSLILIRPYGLIGVAIGAMIPAVAFQSFLYPLFLGRLLEIPMLSYVRHVLVRPVIVGLILCLFMVIFRQVGPASNWALFFLYGSISMSFACAATIVLGLDKAERYGFFDKAYRLVRPREQSARVPKIRSRPNLIVQPEKSG